MELICSLSIPTTVDTFFFQQKTSDDYNVHVDLKRNTADKKVEVNVAVMDMETFKNVIPDTLMEAGPTSKLGTKSESVWINFQCAGGNYLRVGVNPKVSLAIIFHISHFFSPTTS